MNILLINHYAGSPEYGMEFRPFYMAQEWKKAKHNVLIVTASYSHVRTKQFQTRNDCEAIRVADTNYIVLKTPSYDGNGFRRVLNIITFVFKLFRYQKKICNEFIPDIVIASSTYPLDIFPAKKIATQSKAKLVYEVHDLWPLAPKELGGYSIWHPYIVVMQKAENYAYKNADSVISIWPKAKEYMIKHGMKPEKFVYIPNGIVTEEWNIDGDIPGEIKELFNRLRKENKFIIGYTGSHGLANSLETLILAMGELREENINLLMVGKGPEKQRLIELTKKLGLNNVHFFNPINKKQIPSLLDKLDILYVGIKKQELFKYGLCPNKMIDYMMAGKPIIQAYTAGINLVEEAGCGIVVKSEDTAAIAEAIKQLIRLDHIKLEKIGDCGKEYCLKYHDYRKIALLFLSKI